MIRTREERHHPAPDHLVERNAWYDAYYCATCNVWLEDKCRDPACEFCAQRPDKPFECTTDDS